ncbi:MAG: ABC transporter permease [Bacillota bacterium]|nr:hypothetical protein [Bacillota bacterium]
MSKKKTRRRSAWREVWSEFLRSPRGVFGLVLFLIFLFLGLAAPWLTPYDPVTDRSLAAAMARPAWMRLFPKYKDAPVTVDVFLLRNWHVAERENVEIDWREREGADVMVITSTGEGGGRLVLEHKFEYDAGAPDMFILELPYAFSGGAGVTGQARITLETPAGDTYRLFESRVLRNEQRWTVQRVDSRDLQLKMRLGFQPFANVAKELFGERGEYRLVAEFEMTGASEAGAATFTVGESRFRIPGQLHGLLGTDHLGADLWSQFVYGTRTSLLIGFVVAIIAVFVGTLVGIVSGYLGGWVDELLMRIVDVMISIPFLPIMIVVVAIVGQSIEALVFLVAIFSWMSVARLVRSQTLTLRERTFVEAARAAGARPGYIMRAHILPNVLGLVFASLVLLIPSAILTEATMSFLGFGDPTVPTWGRMLQNAKSFGAFTALAWWWILPPGLALTLLALAFVFMGNTLDDILNRRNGER